MLFRSLVLAAAVAGVAVPSYAQPIENAATTQPAVGDAAAVPVKVVVLFSSGVGYFEHYGTVQGSRRTELRFKTAQINDILKSLVLQDLDGGRVTSVTYPSQDPIAKTLRSFQLDITANPGLAELLNQLRGAKVTITVNTTTIEGTVLGVENRQKPGKDNQPIVVPVLNLVGGGGIRSVELNEIRDFKIDDPRLAAELDQALAALAQSRDQDKKPVQIGFLGEGERRVKLGYVVETPIWKTSYRLLLDDPKKNDPATPTTVPTGGGNLQGWALVENQTDNDWTDVQLSLVSGRPISFIQDLYQPLYIARPVVVPELYASLRPQQYEGGVDREARKASSPMPSAAPMEASRARRAAGGAGGGGTFAGGVADSAASQMQPMDAGSSISSVASASNIGELFQYTVGNVTLPRQKSAMLPIITDPISVQRVSIFNLAVLPKNPLNGAIVTNTTDKHLLQGPITVFDGGSYAGDARIDNLPPGQNRLLSYGVDLQVIAQGAKTEINSRITSGKVVNGVLELRRRVTNTLTYTFENKTDRVKSLVIEHQRLGGNWELVDTAKPYETTDDLYRFRIDLPSKQPADFKVVQGSTEGENIALIDRDFDGLRILIENGEIAEPVKAALRKAYELRNAVAVADAKLAEFEKSIATIATEQQRIRENLRTVNNPSDQYYGRLLKKLNEQESQIEAIQKDRDAMRETRAKAQADYENYLKTLNVG